MFKGKPNFETLDEFSAFHYVFEKRKSALMFKFGLDEDKLYDLLYEDFVYKMAGKYNPHQVYAYLFKRFDWVVIQYLRDNKEVLLNDYYGYDDKLNENWEKHYQTPRITGNEKVYKPKREPKYRRKDAGQPRPWMQGRTGLGHPPRPVAIYWKGKYIRSFESTKECARYLKRSAGNMYKAIDNIKRTVAGYHIVSIDKKTEFEEQMKWHKSKTKLEVIEKLIKQLSKQEYEMLIKELESGNG